MENQNQFVVSGSSLPVQPSPAMMPQPKPKMKRWKKVLLWIFGVVVVLVIVAFNIPRILTLMHPGDAVLVDDSQIRLQPISVPDSDNGFFDLNQITPDMVKLPASDPSFDLEYTNNINPPKWDQQL